MNDKEMKEQRKRQLDNLSDDDKEYIAHLAANGNLVQVVQELAKRGLTTSPATVSRFLRRQKEERMLQEADEDQRVVNTFADRSKNDKLRQGTLEAVRQRMYEQAMESRNPEFIQKMYETLLKEEARLRELDLEARRTAVTEENLKLQRQRLQIDAFKTALKDVPEALRILCDEKLDDKSKVIEARRCLSQWNDRSVSIAVEHARQIEAPVAVPVPAI